MVKVQFLSTMLSVHFFRCHGNLGSFSAPCFVYASLVSIPVTTLTKSPITESTVVGSSFEVYHVFVSDKIVLTGYHLLTDVTSEL